MNPRNVVPSLFCFALLALASVAAQAGNSWVPLGPDLINDGQTMLSNNRVPVTGRINVVVANPANPLGDVWIGSAGGGVWRGSVSPGNFWEPMTDDAASLAVGAIALDSCLKSGCATVWVGTGENSIRRDTQYGKGVLKGERNSGTNTYEWTLLGEDKFARGSITKIVLDPTTPDNSGKRVFATLSTGETANGSHSTVTTTPTGALGVWRSKNAGQTWANVLNHQTPATDLEMDPQNHNILFAGLRHDGLFRSLDGGDTWQPIGQGIPKEVLATADWPEIAVFRTPGMDAAILYTALAACPHPHEKLGPISCSPNIYASTDGGSFWQIVYPSGLLLPLEPGLAQTPGFVPEPIISYASYTHALMIHPTNPFIVWYGGINLYKFTALSLKWERIGYWTLHPDHHNLFSFPAKGPVTGIVVYEVNDGGFFVGDGDGWWDGTFQQGLAVTQFQSVSAAPEDKFLFGGTQDNGTNVYQGTEIWQHVDDGDSASTLVDLDDPGTLYDIYVGATPARCKAPNLCKFGWPSIAPWPNGFAEGKNSSWYPPFEQDPTDAGGQHPLYFPTTRLYRSLDDGDHWDPVSDPQPGGPIAALANIDNPISAIAVAPGNPDRLYIGYYDGKVLTTANGQSASPSWTTVTAGLPGRPVTAIAVHPADDQTVLVAFAGLGAHSVYRSKTAGASWGPIDDSVFGDFALASVNTLLIEPAPPHAVWAGTDSGVYQRDDVDSSVSIWYPSAGLPNVAVYDLDLAKDGKMLYAGTHGRGVWRLSLAAQLTIPDFYEEACCGYFDPYQPAPFVSVSVEGFDPLERCSLALYEGDRLCASSEVDADGATLSTDAHGFLVAEKEGYYSGRRVSFACNAGSCARGVPYSRCEVSEVEVACGRRSVRSAVTRAEEVREPASTRLAFAAVGKEGSFTLTPTLKKNGGLSQPLCAVDVRYTAEDTEEKVLARAEDAVNSDARCRDARVQAVLSGSWEAGSGEDEGAQPFRLSLSAPEQTGVELVTEVTGYGPTALAVEGYGVPRQGSRVAPRLVFAGRATGGQLEIREVSRLGTCTFAVDTREGDTPESVAAAVQQAFLGRPDTSAFKTGPSCPARQNARDVHLDGAALFFGLGQQVSVTNTDAGLTYTLGSDR